MTLLEVVFAVALLALVAAAAMSTVTLLITLTVDDQKTLGAQEVAHKLLLQYLDEKKKMPSTSAPIDYAGGRFTYRYRLEETNMEMRTKARESKGGAADLRADRFKLITVRVYDGVSVGGTIMEGDELAVMSRMMDPIAIMRNPDSMKRMFGDEEGIRTILGSFMGGGGGTSPATAVPRPGKRSGGSPGSKGSGPKGSGSTGATGATGGGRQ
jgi:hypothetical protein